MKNVTLVREPSTDMGTFGKFSTPLRSFVSGELPWRDNVQGLSCVPVGSYICKWQYSPSHNRNVYHLQNVPDRTDVEIHPGNYCGDTSKMNESAQEPYRTDVKGCILLGMNKEMILGQMMLGQSRTAVGLFEAEMNGEDFQLSINEAVS